MSFPTYPAYKDSGVEWLGAVPEHWGVSPLKWLAEQVTDKATTSEFQVGLENIEGWTGRFIETDTEFAGDGIAFRQEDILFGKLRPYLAKVWLADRSGQAVGDFFVLRPRAVNGDFLHKYILTPTVIEDLNASTIGAKMPRVGWEDMAALAVSLPPYKEQTQIARFLDHETARIDALIAEQQCLIELLKEKRQAVISHAVTKGLDPTVPMKHSGVEWLGEVPAHWRAVRLRHCLVDALTYGANEPSDEANLEHPRYIRITDLNDDGTLSAETYKSLPPEKAEPYMLEEGDVLFARSGATVGKSFLYSREYGPACYAGYLIRARVNKRALIPMYLWMCTQSRQYEQFIGESNIQATIQNVSAEKYGNMWIALPEIEEQEKILAELEIQLSQFKSLMETSVGALVLLQERRSALISAAVTGKIDVRSWQPPASTQAPKLEVAEAN
ncbi:restriction endonuclease subunit S [Pseudomonas aeruginosa]|nr:restriction endonuclease subunit S [Pseudomonas aeruginosa]